MVNAKARHAWQRFRPICTVEHQRILRGTSMEDTTTLRSRRRPDANPWMPVDGAD
jgi:hypothetical protein